MCDCLRSTGVLCLYIYVYAVFIELCHCGQGKIFLEFSKCLLVAILLRGATLRTELDCERVGGRQPSFIFSMNVFATLHEKRCTLWQQNMLGKVVFCCLFSFLAI